MGFEAEGCDGQAASDQGCCDGSATDGSAGAVGDRSGDGKPAGGFAADDRRYVVGCVCADAGVDDLYAAEPVSRGAGGCGRVSAGPGCLEEYLCEEHDGRDGSAVGGDTLR